MCATRLHGTSKRTCAVARYGILVTSTCSKHSFVLVTDLHHGLSSKGLLDVPVVERAHVLNTHAQTDSAVWMLFSQWSVVVSG